MNNQQSSSMSPMGGRLSRAPHVGASQNSANMSNSQQSNGGGLNINMRENLNKSQNVQTSAQSITNAYAPTQVLQSSSRQKKTSLSFLRKSNITAAGQTGGSNYQQNSNTPQKNSLNLGSKRINMITGSGSGTQNSRLAGLNQSKSQPGLVKIRTTAINNASGDQPVPNANLYKHGMPDNTIVGAAGSRKQPSDGKNPAKSLNATINLEQMLNGAKSSRVLPQPQRNSMALTGNHHQAGSNIGSQRNSNNPAANMIAGDVDPVQISSLLNDGSAVSPSKAGQPGAGPQPINPSAVTAGSGGNGGSNYQVVGNTPLKGRRKQPQQSPGAVQMMGNGSAEPAQSFAVEGQVTTANTTQNALQSFIESNNQHQQQRQSHRNMSNQSAKANLPKTGSISSEVGGQSNLKRGSHGIVDQSENNSNVGSVAAQSVGEQEDMASLMHKFKQLRRENQQLRNLLRQNELIINQNIDALKQERGMSLRLCQAILPLIKRYTNRNEDQEGESKQQKSQIESPKTPEELIGLLEKISKDAQAIDFFKKIFQQDPVASENRFLNETMQNLQQRMASSEQRCELMQRLNENLAEDLGFALDELDALKRTVIDSHSLVVQPLGLPSKPATQTDTTKEDELVIPAYLRVLQAEQTLLDNFVYEDTDEQLVASQQQRIVTGAKLGQEEIDEVEVDNENSIPQESSIAGSVSFQNQRRATGTLNASSSQHQIGRAGGGISRGKSTPVLAGAGMGQGGGVPKPAAPSQQKGNNSSNQLANNQHPTMVGASKNSSSLSQNHPLVARKASRRVVIPKARSAQKKVFQLPSPLPPIDRSSQQSSATSLKSPSSMIRANRHQPIIIARSSTPSVVANPSRSALHPVAIGNPTQSKQQPNPLLSSGSQKQLQVTTSYSRFNNSQRIMTQELRGLGNSSTRARNALNLSLKPKAAIAGRQSSTIGTRGGPVKVQNFVDSEVSNLPNEEQNQKVAQADQDEELKAEATQPPTRSFSPVVFVKKYLNIAI